MEERLQASKNMVKESIHGPGAVDKSKKGENRISGADSKKSSASDDSDVKALLHPNADKDA